jgi:LysM repeat protein
VYTVKRYDTLWSIASSHYGGDPRGAIYRLEERNGLTGTVVQPGQKLVLP